MPNTNIRAPYGDIYTVSTPHIDRVTNQLYAEQKQRELRQEQQNKMLDDEFARNLSGIRDADIGDLTKAYGDFKIAHIELQKKGNRAGTQDQLELLRKKAAVYDVITKSKIDKQWEDEQAKQIMTDKKGYYANDAHQQLIQRRNTPLSRLDKTKDDKLLYEFHEPNLTKQLKEAQGTDAEIPIKVGVSKTDPLKDDIEVYKAGNAPDKFANKLLEGVMASNDGRNFAGIMNHKYDDAQLEDLKNRYTAKVNDPKFIAVYGEPKPLPAPDTDLGKAVAIRTMEEFANKEIKPAKLVSQINAGRAMKERQQFAIEQQKRGADFAMQRLLTFFNVKRTAENEDDFKGTAALMNNTKDIIENGKPQISLDGEDKNIVTISDFNLLKTLGSLRKYPIDEITFDKKKDQFNVHYYQKDWVDDSGTKQSLPAETIPVSARDYLRIKVDEMNPKNKGKTNANVDKLITESGGLYKALQKVFSPDAVNQTHTKITESKTSKQLEHTRDEYKSAGWTDEQINKAVKAGKIKIR